MIIINQYLECLDVLIGKQDKKKTNFYNLVVCLFVFSTPKSKQKTLSDKAFTFKSI